MKKKPLFERLRISAKQIFVLLAIMLLLEVLNHLSNYALTNLGGLIPRDPYRLYAVFTAPLLHGSAQHFLVNSISFAILGCLICLQDRRLFIKLSFFCAFFAGLGVWLVGRNSIHVGSSLLIFSYFGFLLASGWYAKNWKSFFLAIVVFIFFGGMFFGLLPTKEFISWESHLFGFIAGIVYAKIAGPRD